MSHHPEPLKPSGAASTFRFTEYLLPLLLVLLAAWGGWALIQRSRERARERAPQPLPLLPGVSNRPAAEAPRAR